MSTPNVIDLLHEPPVDDPPAGRLELGASGVVVVWHRGKLEVVGKTTSVLTAADDLALRVTRGERPARGGYASVLAVEILSRGQRVQRLRATVPDAAALDGLPWGKAEGAHVELAPLLDMLRAVLSLDARVVEWPPSATERPDALPTHHSRDVHLLSRLAVLFGGWIGGALCAALLVGAVATAGVVSNRVHVAGADRGFWPVAPGFEPTDAGTGTITDVDHRGQRDLRYRYLVTDHRPPLDDYTGYVPRDHTPRLSEGDTVSVVFDPRTGASTLEGFPLRHDHQIEADPWSALAWLTAIGLWIGLVVYRRRDLDLLRNGVLSAGERVTGRQGGVTFRDRDGITHRVAGLASSRETAWVVYWPDAPERARLIKRLPGSPKVSEGGDDGPRIVPSMSIEALAFVGLAAFAALGVVTVVVLTVAQYL